MLILCYIIVRFFVVQVRIRDRWQILYLFVQRFVMWLSLCGRSLPNLQCFIALKASPALAARRRVYCAPLSAVTVFRIMVKDRARLE